MNGFRSGTLERIRTRRKDKACIIHVTLQSGRSVLLRERDFEGQCAGIAVGNRIVPLAEYLENK